MSRLTAFSDQVLAARGWSRGPTTPRRLMAGGLIAVAVVLAFLPDYASDYSTVVGYQVFQLAALAQAWNLLAGYAGLVSLASSAFVGLGEYATAWITIHSGIPLLPAMLISGVVGALFAALVATPIFRFRGLYFAIATLVLGQALLQFMINFNGLGGNAGLTLTNNAPTDAQLYQLTLALTVLATIALVVVRRLRLGSALLAIRDDEDVAREVGVPTFRAKFWAFLISGAVMAIVGGLQADKLGHIDPSGAFSLQWTIDIVNAAIIGGLGTLLGPIVGALFIVEFGIRLANYPELHVALTGALLIIVIRFAPRGIWGSVVGAIAARWRAASGAAPSSGRAGGAYRGRAFQPGSVERLLEIDQLSKAFGGVRAVEDVSFHVDSGEILGIIGPNGAGKSTLIGLLSGALEPSAGRLTFAGQAVQAMTPEQRAGLGIGRTHQVPRPFATMTVRENLEVACLHGGGLRRPGDARREATGILELTGLAEFADVRAEDLGLLRLKRLELARALALRPRLLLLDEIAAGLVESEVHELTALIKQLRAEVESMIIVEHVLDVIHACADRVVVLDRGRKLLEGEVATAMADPQVAAVYLGTGGGETEAPRTPPAPVAAVREVRPQPLLRATGLSASYGHSRALTDVTIEIGEGQIVGLLGANGAGKTTTARVLSGMIAPTAGEIEFAGRRLDGLRAHEFVASGIAHCMEGRRIFGELSVEENLLVGGRTAPSKDERARRLREVYELFDALSEKRNQSGKELSGGQQQQLAVGRALMAAPRLMLLDEISLGLAPVIVDRVYEALAEINRRGVAMLIVEQNVERGLTLADHVYVLEKGRVALAGRPREVRGDPRLLALYVGEAKGAAVA
jgi:branched-chain amino acid transport system ATP-binding protein